MGYIGGLLGFRNSSSILVQPEIPILVLTENGENIRATNLLVALWFLVFSIPTFIWVQDRRPEKGKFKESVTASFMRLFYTFQELKNYRIVARFLLARLVYNDALVTIFAFGGIYAAGIIGFTFEEIMILGIVLNVTAGLGAFLMGYLDDSKGSRKIVQSSILFLSFACLLGFVAPIIPTWFIEVSWLTSKNIFWIAAILIGFFSGPNQSASRSMMAHYTS